MRELDPIRRAAPPVEPLAPDALARIRARALDRGRRPRRRVLPLLAPVAVAAATVAVVLALGGGGADEEVPARPAPQADTTAPRYLLGDGWRVTRIDEWSADTGEMTFARAGRELVLRWVPTRLAGEKVGAAKDAGSRPERHVDVAGTRASVWRYAGSDEYTAVWRAGAVTLEARGRAESADAFAAVVGGFAPAGPAAWERALPASAVQPRERGDAVDAMLEGLPLPPGFDRERLRAGAATRDRYQLGAQVAGTVACGWLAAWAEAKADGDDAAVRRAVAALASSHEWAILREMEAEGDYPDVLWQYADAVAGDGTVEGGRTLTVEESYRAALCP